MNDRQSQDVNSSVDSTSLPSAVPPKSRWYKRKLFWILILVIAVAIAAGATYLYYGLQSQQVAHTGPDIKTVVNLDPQALVYASSVEKIVSKGCLQKTDTVHYKNLSNQKATDAVTISDSQGVTASATYHDTVVLATEPSCTSKEGSGLWLSQDGGKTYKKIYIMEKTLGRITSIAFSADGNEVAFGSLPAVGDRKAVRAITIKSGKARDLFTSNETGYLDTFYDVKAYDQKKQIVYYLEGCATCDRGSEGPLLQYDLKSDRSSAVLEPTKSYRYSTIISDDVSRVLRVEFASEPTEQLQRFTINEFNLTTKKQTNFATYTGTASSGVVVGYTSDGSVYYTTDKKVILIQSNGETSELAQIPDQAAELYYVGKSRIIYRTSDQSGGGVVDYDIKSGKSTHVFKYEYPTIPLGIIGSDKDKK